MLQFVDDMERIAPNAHECVLQCLSHQHLGLFEPAHVDKRERETACHRSPSVKDRGLGRRAPPSRDARVAGSEVFVGRCDTLPVMLLGLAGLAPRTQVICPGALHITAITCSV